MLPYRSREYSVKKKKRARSNCSSNSKSRHDDEDGDSNGPTGHHNVGEQQQQQQQEAHHQQSTGGGLVQEALMEDLITVRNEFVQHLTQWHDNNNNDDSDMEETTGHVFGLCKQVFRHRRIAAWHTRFLPPRCSASAWSQLLYASCWALLPTSSSSATFRGEGGSGTDNRHQQPPPQIGTTTVLLSTLTEAAFAIFALYILHQTNPLPPPPPPPHFHNHHRHRHRHEMALLSTGLRDRETTHHHYRRHFRPYIRVDTATFTALLHWREEARALCDVAAIKKIEVPEDDMLLSNTPSLVLHAKIAQDILSVLELLWGQLDYVSYTGPRGLEAWAGHPAYPFQNPEADTIRPKPPPPPPPVSALDGKQKEDTGKISLGTTGETLQKCIDDYLVSRRSIRLPPPVDTRHRRRLDRLRAALRPVFAHHHKTGVTGPSLEDIISKLHNNDKQLATTILQSKPRMVTFSVVESVLGSQNERHTLQSKEVSSKKQPGESNQNELDEGDAKESYELLLPEGASMPLKRSLESAVEGLLEHDSMALMGSILPTVTVPVGLPHDDGVSTLAPPPSLATAESAVRLDNDGAASVAAESFQSGVGRDALGALLEQVAMSSTTEQAQKSSSTAKTRAKSSAASVHSSAGREALQALLEEVAQKPPASRKRGRAKASSNESTHSNAGQAALQALLEEVAINRTPTKRTRRSTTRTSSGDTSHSDTGREALQALLERVNDLASQGEDGSIAVETTVTAESGLGRDALQLLLEKVQKEQLASKKPRKQRKAQKSSTAPSISSQQSAAGHAALQSLLQQAADSSVQDTSTTKTAPSRNRSQPARGGTSFLTDGGAPTNLDSYSPSLDDLSDFSADEQDDFSEAVSSLGRRAIQELLESAETKKPPARKTANSFAKSSQTHSTQKIARKERKARSKLSNEPDSNLTTKSNDDEKSTVGNDALKHLLSKVN